MVKYRSGQKLICEPCGRELIIGDCGASTASIWCCAKPMKPSRSGKSSGKTAKKKQG